jgi:hypothetical protein
MHPSLMPVALASLKAIAQRHGVPSLTSSTFLFPSSRTHSSFLFGRFSEDCILIILSFILFCLRNSLFSGAARPFFFRLHIAFFSSYPPPACPACYNLCPLPRSGPAYFSPPAVASLFSSLPTWWEHLFW